MLKFVTSGALAALMAGAAFSLTPQDELTTACVEGGNEREQCECAAGMLVETLDENELAFMMDVMEADSSDPAIVMPIAAEHGLDMTGIMEMGQKMAVAEPEMRERCGVEDWD